MAYISGAEYSAMPYKGEKSNLGRRVLDTLFSTFTPKVKDVDVNGLKDWDPIKLRSFGYTDLEIDYLFAKANQSR